MISPREEGIFWDTNGICLNDGAELVIEDKAYNLSTMYEFDDWLRSLHLGKFNEQSNAKKQFLTRIREVLEDEVEIFYGEIASDGCIINYELVPNVRLWQNGNHSGLRYRRIK